MGSVRPAGVGHVVMTSSVAIKTLYPSVPKPVAHRFAVIHWGARLHYAAPSVLSEAGLLHVLYTDASAESRGMAMLQWWPPFMRPRMLRRWASRTLPESISRSLIRSFDYPTIQQKCFDYFAGRRRKSAALTNRLRIGGHWLAHKAIRDRFLGANALYVHPCVSTDAVAEAKRRGMLVVLEAISHPYNKIVEKEEYERYGQPAPSAEAEIWDNIEFFKSEAMQADVVLAASPYVRSGLIQLGLSSDKIALVPYGIEDTFFREDPKPEPGRILYVGNVGYLKGVPYLAHAARLLRAKGFEGRVRVVGPHDGKMIYQREFRGPEYIGQVPRAEVRREFLSADIFVFPTLSDGFGIVLLEAMAAGLPVICTPNCAGIVQDGVSGFIVSLRDSVKLAARIEELVADRALRERMGEAARATAADLSLEHYRRAMLAAIE